MIFPFCSFTPYWVVMDKALTPVSLIKSQADFPLVCDRDGRGLVRRTGGAAAAPYSPARRESPKHPQNAFRHCKQSWVCYF